MKMKKLLDLSEATVTLVTVDHESLLLQDFLLKEKIKSKLIKSEKIEGYPVFEYSGSKDSLEKMIHSFFGDDDLKKYIIEGSLDPEEKIIRIYKKGKDSAKMKKQEDNSILIVYTLANSASGGGLKFEFRNANDATRYLESNGWELDELHESELHESIHNEAIPALKKAANLLSTAVNKYDDLSNLEHFRKATSTINNVAEMLNKKLSFIDMEIKKHK